MSIQVQCVGCGKKASVSDRMSAARDGWAFVEITVAWRVKYCVYCPDDKPRWLATALKDEPKADTKAEEKPV